MKQCKGCIAQQILNTVLCQGDQGRQVAATSMGMGMGMGGGGGDFPTAIIEGPPGPPGNKGEIMTIFKQQRLHQMNIIRNRFCF